jgi:hypothetical protein
MATKLSRDALIEATAACVRVADQQAQERCHNALAVYLKKTKPNVLKRNRFALDLTTALSKEFEQKQ